MDDLLNVVAFISFLDPDSHDGMRRCSSVEAGKHGPAGEIESVDVGGLVVRSPERAVADQVQASPEGRLGHRVRLDEGAGGVQARNHLTARGEDAAIRKDAEVLRGAAGHRGSVEVGELHAGTYVEPFDVGAPLRVKDRAPVGGEIDPEGAV